MNSKKNESEVKEEIMFTKEQIISSNKYSGKRDVLGAILADDGSYTLQQVDSLVDKFMKGQVK